MSKTKKLKLSYSIVIIAFVTAIGCRTYKAENQKIPTETIPSYALDVSSTKVNDTLKVSVYNPLKSPVRVMLKTKTSDSLILTRLLKSEEKSNFNVPSGLEKKSLNLVFRLGDPELDIVQKPFQLPFPNGRKYNIIQGNQASYTHNRPASLYALDIGLAVGDTISAVDDGYVVSLIDGYKHSGKGDEWKPYGNFITLYHPHTGLYTQYVHLTYQGSLVKMHDKVTAGQAIAISGMTGQTDTPHLHFNCLRPQDGGRKFVSVPYKFVEGYNSVDLRRGDKVVKGR